MARWLAVLLVLVMALVVVAPALAQTQTPVPQPGQPDDGDISRSMLLVIGGGLVALFAVIGYAITRDARHSLPEDKRRGPAALREEGPHRKQRDAKAKARAKGRAQRAARRAGRRH